MESRWLKGPIAHSLIACLRKILRARAMPQDAEKGTPRYTRKLEKAKLAKRLKAKAAKEKRLAPLLNRVRQEEAKKWKTNFSQ